MHRGREAFVSAAWFLYSRIGPLFPASGRKNNVVFQYPWSERDHVTIELPEGFVLDSPDVPSPIKPEMTQGISEQTITMAATKDGHTLIYERKFFFGGKGGILFPVKSYAPLKQLFDMINKGDDHTITLKQAAASASN